MRQLGPRMCHSWKSTLVRQLGKGRDAEWRNLDRSATLEAARSDPTGFVAFPELVVIDEIQRARAAARPEGTGRYRPSAGRYLLTGSARVLGCALLPIRRRERFFDACTTDLITRDVSQLSDIERTREMQTLLRLLAARSGHLLVERALSNETSLSASTVRRYLSLLQEIFLIKRIPA